ncbi:hypothetical protein Tco_0854531 [Tanacetum coccineum]
MGDENPIRTLGDYFKPSHEGYRNTIELPVGNNVDLTLYDNESWNDLRDLSKSVKAIALPQDVSSTSDRRLVEHENQYCIEDPEQAFVEYISSRTDEAGGALPSDMVRNPKLSTSPVFDSYDEKAKENEEEEKDILKNIHVNPSTPLDPSVAFITEKFLKFNSFFESLGLFLQSSDTEVVCTKGDDGEFDGEVMFKIVK